MYATGERNRLGQGLKRSRGKWNLSSVFHCAFES